MPKLTKPAKTARTASVVLTDKQKNYAEGVLNGKSKAQAVKDAGYKTVNSTSIEKSQDVQAYLKEARNDLATATKYTRERVLEMFEEAYDMAKLAAEPASMTAAAREIGRMLGFYEATEVKVNLTSEQKLLLGQFRGMSQEELLQIADGKALVIDGEFRRLS
jgi:hypothetical protein